LTRDIATAIYYTGIDPFTGKEVYVAPGLRDTVQDVQASSVSRSQRGCAGGE
jgi:hypothetical protein